MWDDFAYQETSAISGDIFDFHNKVCVWGLGYWYLWVEVNDAAEDITVHSSITKYRVI